VERRRRGTLPTFRQGGHGGIPGDDFAAAFFGLARHGEELGDGGAALGAIGGGNIQVG
jgi:hypothetical protein